MPFWKPTHQARKSLQDFLRRIPGLVFRKTGLPAAAPPIPLVLRVGAAGPLTLGDKSEELGGAVSAILSALQRYTVEIANPRFHQQLFSIPSPPPAELRLVSQLASGFDQLAAAVAAGGGYRLHLVLPGSRSAFRNDIRTNCHRPPLAPSDRKSVAVPPDAGEKTSEEVAQFDRIITVADRVLELDCEDDSSDTSPLSLPDYAQAGAVILDHCDVVVLVVHDEKDPALGGTRWMEQRATERGLTIVLVPFDKPHEALLVWTFNGRRETRRLFAHESRTADPSVFAAALDHRLLGPPFKLGKIRLGWLELRMFAQLDPNFNASLWDARWKLDGSEALAEHDLGEAPMQVDGDLKAVKVWADHRASAMAELVRGSFIFCAALGALAVAGALLGVIFTDHIYSSIGKILELSFLGLILWVMQRAHHYNWRARWLSLRQLERYLEQAAWLILLGRSRTYSTPSHLARFETDEMALWTNAYFRAVLRNCSFPTARFTADYLKTVHALVLRNLVMNQIAYFTEEVAFQRKSDKVLEAWTRACVATAVAITGAYLLANVGHWAHVLPPANAVATMPAQHILSGVGALVTAAADKLLSVPNTVSAIGALLTAIAATLAAVRSHGEYAQIANRYEGARDTLETLQAQLAARLPDQQPGFSSRPMRSAALATVIGSATDVLIQEAQGWHAILQMKEIEPI